MRHFVASHWRVTFLGVLAAATVAPFCSVRILGMGDALNHLARMHILASIGQSADLQRYYTVAWAPIPYLAMDAVVPWLAGIIGIYPALKLYVLACVLLPFLAILALRKAAGEEFSTGAAAGLLLGTNYALGLGFLNFVFMAGLAMLAFAAWIATEAWGRVARLAVFSCICLLLYLGHAFGFLAYGCAVAGYEGIRAVRVRFRPWKPVLRHLELAAVPAVPVMVLALSLDTRAGAPGRIYTYWGDLPEKLLAFTSPLLFLNDPVQQACLRIGVFVLMGCAAMRFAPRLWPAAAFTFLAAFAVPEILLSTWLTDFRLPLTASILLAASLSRTGVAGRYLALLRLGLAALVLAKAADAWRVLHVLDAQEAQMQHVLAALPRGARLLVADESQPPPHGDALGGSTLWTMPLMAVIERDAFMPALFTGLTVVHVRPEYAAQTTPQGVPTTLKRLVEDLRGEAPNLTAEEAREGLRVYWHNWPNRFDYVLVEHFYAPLPEDLPGRLVPVAFTEDLGLFSIAPE